MNEEKEFGLADVTFEDQDGNVHTFEVEGGEITLTPSEMTFESVRPFMFPLGYEGTATITKTMTATQKKHFKQITLRGVTYTE